MNSHRTHMNADRAQELMDETYTMLDRAPEWSPWYTSLWKRLEKLRQIHETAQRNKVHDMKRRQPFQFKETP